MRGQWAFRKPERALRFWDTCRTRVDFMSFMPMSFVPPSWRILWTRWAGLGFAVGAAIWLIVMWRQALGAA